MRMLEGRLGFNFALVQCFLTIPISLLWNDNV